MSASKRVRQFHRWMSMTFLLTVVITSVALAVEAAVDWIVYLPLPPLALLAFTGIYLFALPYTAKRRSRQGVRP